MGRDYVAEFVDMTTASGERYLIDGALTRDQREAIRTIVYSNPGEQVVYTNSDGAPAEAEPDEDGMILPTEDDD